MYKIFVRILSGILSAAFTVATLCINDQNVETDKVNLQSPSLMYASMSNRYLNAAFVPEEDEEEIKAEEADSEKEDDAFKSGISSVFDLGDYTITAPADYEEIAEKVRGDEGNDEEENQESYDGKFVWTKDGVTKVYEEPSSSSKVVGQLKRSSKAIRISYTGDWSYIRFSNNKKGYVLTKNVSTKKVNTPTPTPRPARRYSSGNKSTKTTSSKKSGSKKSGGFGSFVRRFVGCKYVPGGSSPSGFDCSGFTMYCYRAYYGIRLPHGANMQSSYGRKVSRDSMRVGDIIYIDHDHNGKADHVGIYVGGGQMVHASGVGIGVVCVSVSNIKDFLMVRRIR